MSAPPAEARLPEGAAPAQSNLHMTGLLSARFRQGMRPLAWGTALCVALSAPLADFLLERHDLAGRAHVLAADVAGRLSRASADGAWSAGGARAILASLDAPGGAGPGEADRFVEARLRSPSGALVAHTSAAGQAPWLAVTARAPVIAGGDAGTVEVTLAEPEGLHRDLLLLVAFSVLGAILGLSLYYFPLRLFRGEDIVRLFAWRAIRAADEERLRLSHELHDGVGQSLSAAAVAAARLVARTGSSPEATESARLIDGALGEVRRVARGLRPPALDDLGLGAAVEGLARAAAGTGLLVRTDIEELPRIDPDLEQTCFRLAQEALANVQRHARASHVRVLLARDADRVILEVQDDGRGFAPQRRLGLGLAGARERAARLAGSLSIESAEGQGTLLRAVLPLRVAT